LNNCLSPPFFERGVAFETMSLVNRTHPKEPPVQAYDKSSKWLIQRHGDSILRLAGIDNIVSWQPLQAELVQPRRLPDGLLEVMLEGDDTPDLYILEIATYPEPRLALQATRDAALVYLDRGILPEVLVIFLHPRGNVEAANTADFRSRHGWTTWHLTWKTVELWNVPADQLLESADIGLIPWVPLTHFTEPPETIISRCRARIDRDAPANEHENLLAVTQTMLSLRYTEKTFRDRLRDLLRGRQAMIESPLIEEFKAEWTRETRQRDLMRILHARFGVESRNIEFELNSMKDENLDVILDLAATAATLASFREQLTAIVEVGEP
jgi:hypothetical protein